MVLIHRVNPQSFHWTMEVSWPGPAGARGDSCPRSASAQQVLAARSAMSDAPVRALREDW
ncbi:MAG: hypothetical protein R3E41_13260 [Burkholderiaceae bacterium]